MLYPFSALLARMKYITRWSLMHSTRAESLSEHTCDTALLAHLLCLIAKHYTGTPCRPEVVAVAALYHDAPEIITGDMPTPIKYKNDKIQEAYKEIEAGAARRLLQRLPKDLRDAYEPYLLEAETDEEERRLVKAADKLSALIKCIEEQKAGNQEFLKAKETLQKAVEALDCPEADIFCQEFLPHYYKTLDEL